MFKLYRTQNLLRFFDYQKIEVNLAWAGDPSLPLMQGCYIPEWRRVCIKATCRTPEKVLWHEATHVIQYLLNNGESLGLNAPVTDHIKKFYAPEKWGIESEAYWVEADPLNHKAICNLIGIGFAKPKLTSPPPRR